VIARLDWHGLKLAIDFSHGHSIAIALDPYGAQPAFFAAGPATARPLQLGSFTGSVAAGGSCNAEVIELAPHCHGTHTECIGHLTSERLNVQDMIDQRPVLARVVSLKSEHVDGQPRFRLEALEAALGEHTVAIRALVVRSLPNDAQKRSRNYDSSAPYPVFGPRAMDYLARFPIKHLLLDTPSLDPARDDGRLANHRAWWCMDGGAQPPGVDASRRSVTEMVFVPDELPDGFYWLHLELSPLLGEATPSRPMLYPVEILA
jgi:kynurenine formamidase